MLDIARDERLFLNSDLANIEQQDVFIKRPFLAALVSDAVNDTTPLKRLIAAIVDESIMTRIAEEYRHGRALAIITADLDAGDGG